MSVKVALYGYLSGNAGLTGALATDGVHQGRAPRGQAKPYLTFQRIGAEGLHGQEGALGLDRSTFQFDIWGEDGKPAAVEAASEALRQALDGFYGDLSGIRIDSAKRIDELDRFLPPLDASDEGTERTICTYEIWHGATVPSFS